LTGVVRASSVVYIACRLTFAALLVTFGTWKLRKWNPGQNEPRELREEGEIEVVERLIEVEEESAEAPVAVGSAAMVSGGSTARTAGGPNGRGVTGRPEMVAAAPATAGSGGTHGEPGPTTGLHVPRRT